MNDKNEYIWFSSTPDSTYKMHKMFKNQISVQETQKFFLLQPGHQFGTVLKNLCLPFKEENVGPAHETRHGVAEFGEPPINVGLGHSQISEQDIIKK